jgi:hypothetical protein
LHATQLAVDILVDITAEAQKGILPPRVYRLPHYRMPEEKQFPFPFDTTRPILLGKDNTHVLHQPSDVTQRAGWIRYFEAVIAQENI